MVYLILSNGRVFEGKRFGAEGDVTGELVFTTGAGGYVETLTDPCYSGQIVMQTFPLIGNYGWISGDNETDICSAAGYVVRDWCDAPSNFRCEGDLDAYLKAQGVPGIYGIDTRELTQIIREEGVMAARISSTPDTDMDALKNFTVSVEDVKTIPAEKTVYPCEGEQLYNVALVHFGAVGGIIKELTARGCTVTAIPYTAGAQAVLDCNADGIVLSDGPGDPATYTDAIETVKVIASTTPVLGVGLGHQLLALAMGGSVKKLHHGHRGSNQPVRELSTGKLIVTAQNHGYAVETGSVSGAKETYTNISDDSCEGLEYTGIKALSVQFHPEGCFRPRCDRWIYDEFIDMMGGND